MNRFEKSDQAGRVAVDENLVSPRGWMALDPIDYLKAARDGDDVRLPADSPALRREPDEILDLTVADMAAARLVRSLRGARGAGERVVRIPAEDVVAIGGSDLHRPTPEAPFEDEAEAANDNVGRMLLLVTLLLSVLAGYAYSVLGENDRSAIEVTPPEAEGVQIVMSQPPRAG